MVFVFVYMLDRFNCMSHHILSDFYALQLYRQVLLRRVLAIGILSVCLSVCHDPVVYQAQVR